MKIGKEDRDKIVGAILVLGAFGILTLANILWGGHMIDSDFATQMQLSKICSEEKRIITTSWIYGNELRFINTQIIYGLIFCFTNDWSAVRAVGNAIMYLMLVSSYAYLMKPIKIESKWKWIGAVGVLIPFSLVDLRFVYMSTDYLPPILIMFLYLGSWLRCAYCDDTTPRKTLCLQYIVLSLISLLAGMNGIRSALVIIGPLALLLVYRCAFHTEKMDKREWMAYIVGIGTFLVGFGINRFVLTPKYGFGGYNDIDFADIGSGILLANLEECLGAFLKSLGYASSFRLLSLHGFINLLVLCFCIVVVYILGRTVGHKEEKHSGDLLKQFFIMSELFNFLFYGFTENRLLITRYVIPALSGVIPALAICFAQEKDNLKRRLCFLVAAMFFVGGGLRTYYSLAVNDYNEDRYASIVFLKDNNLNFGYATSWNAGVVMELTDGEIEVVNMYDIENQRPQLQTCPKRWFTEEYDGTPFLLLTREEYTLYRDSDVISKGDLVYEDDAFLILLYENKDDICPYEL